MLTSSSSRPYSRHAAIGTDANASLISHSVTSPGASPARSSTLPITFTAPRPVSFGSTAAEAQALTEPSTFSPCGGGEVLVGQGQRGGRVVGPAAVARGDREALDLRMQHLQRRELLEAGVATRMFIDAELDQRIVETFDLQRDDLVDEGAAVDRCDRTLV